MLVSTKCLNIWPARGSCTTEGLQDTGWQGWQRLWALLNVFRKTVLSKKSLKWLDANSENYRLSTFPHSHLFQKPLNADLNACVMKVLQHGTQQGWGQGFGRLVTLSFTNVWWRVLCVQQAGHNATQLAFYV